MTGPILPSDNSTSLRHHLRQCTASAHEALDASVGSLDSTDHYARYLAGQFRFRGGMERLLAQVTFPAWFGGWRPLPLMDALHADLAALGIQAPDPADGVPGHHLARASGVVGALYVLEGAALGARYLYRSVKDLGLTAETGARHLERQTGSESWQRFQKLLGCPDIDREEAVEAAVATFAYARGAFEKGKDEQS